MLSRSPQRAAYGRRNGLRTESLEGRLLLSSDLGTAWPIDIQGGLGSAADPQAGAADSGAVIWSDLQGAEGEQSPAVDLVAFAKSIAASGTKLYGAIWCSACNEQKHLFEDGADFLPFIEVTNPDRTLNQTGIDDNITAFPTWEFPDSSREVGVLSLETIAARSGVAIPTGVDPSVAPIDDVTLFSGSPLHLALNGYDPNGDPLTYTVTSSNPGLVAPTVLSGNRSARVGMTGWGDMVFQLFEGRVPRAAGRFIELAESGFYDAANNDPAMTAHRVIDNFVMQFGDPTGTGAGGSTLGDFDDQFHPDLQHNNPGGISWAKAGDDTNDSQVFVIDVPTRFLDFNHSYFGQLTEGDSVRDGITATATDSQDSPVVPVAIDSVEIFQDTENGVVMLKAQEGASGEADVTVTVSDGNGHQVAETFHVTVTPDPFNGGPYLNDIGVVQTTVDTPATIPLVATDVEGDAVFFDAVKSGTADYTFTVNNDTGELTVTPPAGFVGQMQILARVRPATSSDTADLFDSQLVSIVVAPDAPTGIDLVSSSDSGTANDDDVTNISPAEFEVAGVTDGALIRLHIGDTVIGQATATGTTATIIVNIAAVGEGTHTLFATQLIDGVESGPSGAMTVTLDTTPPPDFTSTPPTNVEVGTLFEYDPQNAEEGTSGTQYSLAGAPTAAAIDPATGVVSWTPGTADLGAHQFDVVLTDLAGNSRQQTVNLEVLDNADVALRLEVTDAQGTQIPSANVGDDFLLNVYVQDQRTIAQGVFAAFLDILYDAQLVTITGNITYGSEYPNTPQGDTSTPGLINEAGAIAGFNELGPDEYLLLTVPMRAIHAGTVDLIGDPADVLPDNEILVYGSSQGVPSDNVRYGSAPLVIDVSFGANDDVFNVNEDSSATVLDVLANDTPTPGGGGELIITGAGTPTQGGSVQVAADGKSVTYTPAPDFFGEDTFTYTVDDGTGANQATVTVQVAPTNDNPTAIDDTYTVTEDASGTALDVLANDLIAPDTNETLTVTAIGTPSDGGNVTIASDFSHVTYTPAANFFGDETFTYTVGDGNGGTAVATATVTVVPTNDPPRARNDQFSVDEDSADSTLDVLANDDTAGDANETLSITAVDTPDNGGTVTVAADDLSLIYTPAANFFGTERFVYTISDGAGGSAQASVTVIVNGSNDPPTANDDALAVVKDLGPQRLDPLANDSSTPDDAETLVITAVGTPSAGGTVSIIGNGAALEYTPPTSFSGNDTFTYTIQDPSGASAEANITVDVRDFVPSKLSGFVYIDANNNGIRDAEEAPLGGVAITLSGTDFADASVNQQRTSNALGFYEFADLAPGDYTLSQQQPEFLIDGIDVIGTQGGSAGNDVLTMTLAQDTDGQNNNFGELGRQSRVISLFDFFASTPRDAVVVAATSGETSQWYAVEGGWNSARGIDLAVEEATATAALDVMDENNVNHTATLHLTDPTEVQMLGQQGSQQLLRVVASPHTLFPEADCACGEGEVATAVSSAPIIQTLIASAPQPIAEGEPMVDAGIVIANQLNVTKPASTEIDSTALANSAPVTLADSAAVDQVLADADSANHVWGLDDRLLTPHESTQDVETVDLVLARFFASAFE